jgi:DNA-binding transcriptional LysR family regulator
MKRQFDDVLVGSLELFCLAAETGGFTSAATAAGVTPAAVSRSVARLEERLGVRLFVRTTRHIHLTDAGRAYWTHCRQVLDQLAEADREASGEQSEPVGRIRVSVPTTYGHYRLLPVLAEFHRLHPRIQADIHIGNRNIDFGSEGFDLAVRVRKPPESGLVARHLEDAELVLVASPDYLRRRGLPESLGALAEHDCIQFELPSTGRRIPWLFKDGATDIELETDGPFLLSEDVLGGVSLACSGAGVFQAYRFTVERELAQQRLVEILPQHGGRSRPFNLLYPHGRHMPLRVRAFIDFLLESLRRNAWPRPGA